MKNRFSSLAAISALVLSLSITQFGCGSSSNLGPSSEDKGTPTTMTVEDSNEMSPSESVELPSEEEPATDPVDDTSDILDGVESELTTDADSQETISRQTVGSDDQETIDVELSEEQMRTNSLAMLNYLAVLSQRVNASKDSRLELETMYSDLFNNIRPDRIDQPTLDEIIQLTNTIENYRIISVKRERLRYLYEQQRAEAIREAIPSPVAILNVVHSRSLPELLLSIGYIAVDSYTGYMNAANEASLQYLTEGWELDDEQAAYLHSQRQAAFTYMWDMVNIYHLDGGLALNEDAVRDLVEWENNPNSVARERWLERHEDIYGAYGGYWLILAKTYYELGKYQECFDAMGTYEIVRTDILRRDHDYAEMLPLAIAAASKVMTDDAEFESYASSRAAEIVRNSDDSNWELRYVAALVYVDLYSISGNTDYLLDAYDIVLDNVNLLVIDQRIQNEKYLAEVVEETVPAGSTKEQSAEIKEYNKKLKEERKRALPPISQPLLVNCDLLFALAEKLDIPENERLRIDGILHPGGEAAFLVEPLDEAYRMSGSGEVRDSSHIVMEETRITIPAYYLGDSSTVSVSCGSGSQVVPGTWSVKEVKRGTEGDIDTFVVTLENKDAKGCYTDGDTVVITITDGEGEGAVVRTYEFKVHFESFLFFQTVSFERI